VVVGVLEVTLSIPGAFSLKEKRKVVRSLIERTRNKFNASVAEVGDNDIHNRARIGVSVVANDHAFANSMLDKVLDALEDMAIGRADVLDTKLEIMTVS
jgi:uncharacterized protein YlxP (DUF503 family)